MPPYLDSDATLLMAFANPFGTALTAADLEQAKISEATKGYRIDRKTEMALQIKVLEYHLMEHKPDVLHVSVHGHPAEGLLFQNKEGDPEPLMEEDLKNFLKCSHLRRVKLITLNACVSARFAAIVAAEGFDAVGMDGETSNEFAIEFAGAFYRNLATRDDVKDAVEVTRSDLKKHPRTGVRPYADLIVYYAASETARRARQQQHRFQQHEPFKHAVLNGIDRNRPGKLVESDIGDLSEDLPLVILLEGSGDQCPVYFMERLLAQELTVLDKRGGIKGYPKGTLLNVLGDDIKWPESARPLRREQFLSGIRRNVVENLLQVESEDEMGRALKWTGHAGQTRFLWASVLNTFNGKDWRDQVTWFLEDWASLPRECLTHAILCLNFEVAPPRETLFTKFFGKLGADAILPAVKDELAKNPKIKGALNLVLAPRLANVEESDFRDWNRSKRLIWKDMIIFEEAVATGVKYPAPMSKVRGHVYNIFEQHINPQAIR